MMKTRFPILAWLAGLIVCLLLVGSAAAAPAPALPDAAGHLAATPVVARVYINEVMPRPGTGEQQWIELHRERVNYTLYLPLVLRSGAGARWTTPLALTSPVVADPDISGWQVSNQSGGNYTIPAALPPVPSNAFVLIYFDGQGPAADDYDFSDGKAVLHTPAGLTDFFHTSADQAALYTGATHNAQTIRDFVAYGGPPSAAADDAIAAGLWKTGWWVELHLGSGAAEEGAADPTRQSIGLYPGHANLSPDDWAFYQEADLTPGAANPVPRAEWSTVSNGATMASDGFALGWPLVPGATYELQMDDDQNFGSPLISITLTQPFYAPAAPPPAGVYWWRVRPIMGSGQAAAWSAPRQVTIVAVAPNYALQDAATAQQVDAVNVVNITWLRQRKDTRLLCLDGDNEGDPSTNASEEAWDAVHPDAIYVHGRNNCVRASIAMIVTHYGGSLSQDRLAYRLFENWGSPIENSGELNNPLRDLGHDHTTLVCGGDGSNGGALLAWALGINMADYHYAYAKPSFAQVTGWIDAGRPIMRFHGGHQTVIGGYRTLGDGTQQIRLFDPWSGTTWENYNTLAITCYYVPPASAPNVRSDEASIWTDSDGDGIMDWDEQNRFPTSSVLQDTDGDWVTDKQDLREYVFTAAGAYNLRSADFDGDGVRKEADPDNDNDGAVDGCEDFNYNGKYESGLGESDNFNAASHRACTPVFRILQPTQDNPINAGAYNAPDKILVQVQTAVPPAAPPLVYTAGDFAVRIGGLDSTVIAVYQVADTHFLIVAPAAQATADYYDLEVTLQGAYTDQQKRAVFYLPRLRADQVLVIDRSGSMSSDGKMEAAKNAARAFIDHTNVGDMVGVVSFETTAAVNYALTTVAGDAQWNAAKAAVDALTTAGLTALGQGARLGYDQIVGGGQADHDWSMALMTDGMENVTPYWSDPTVGGVIIPSRVVVHTVALGSDADTTLLASIAGSTGGTPYEAGVDLLPSAAAQSDGPFAAGPSAAPPPELPTTLPNRLADIYKAIGEEIGHQQRIFQATGQFCEKPVTFEVPLEKGLPEVIFTVNWDNPQNGVTLRITDPDGNLVVNNPPRVREIKDATHHQFRIAEPMPGVWNVQLRGCAVYLLIVSAWSPTTMHLGFGLPPEQRTVGAPLPIIVVLADAKPIAGADVWAQIQGPNADLKASLQLFDDGHHGDGDANDGVYANVFIPLRPGQYAVKAGGWGVNNSGESFIRYRNGAFTVRPRVAYVWQDDLRTGNAYRDLLAAHGYGVDFVHMGEVTRTNWSLYNLIVVGPETGALANWGTAAAVGALQKAEKPILGLGEGGYAFFGKLSLAIGYPNGAHGTEGRTYVVDTSHAVWHHPYDISIPRDRIITVYEKTEHVGIQPPVRPPVGLVNIGREPASQTHYNLIEQTQRYLLWGFQNSPTLMTAEGRRVFINTVRHLTGM